MNFNVNRLESFFKIMAPLDSYMSRVVYRLGLSPKTSRKASIRENVHLRKNKTFGDKSNKVVRLGYLSHHKPISGLIAIYDESENKLYYDFTFKIISRLKAHLEYEDWKNQQTVTIGIPVSQEVDEQSPEQSLLLVASFSPSDFPLIYPTEYAECYRDRIGVN